MPMVFPSSPTVGQVFSSGGRSWVWTGETWDSPSSATAALSGLTHIRTTDFTAQSTVAFDNVFTNNYRSYKILINGVASPSNITLLAQLRSGGTPVTSATYNYQVFDISATTPFYARVAGGTFMSINSMPTTRLMLTEMTISNPQLPLNTTYLSSGYYPSISVSQINGENTNSSSYDGIQFYVATGTFTGSISIYGMRF